MQQINLHDKRYFEFAKYLGWILLFVFLWIRGCSDTHCITEAKVIKVPEVKGQFELVKPKNIAILTVTENVKILKGQKESKSINPKIEKWSNSTTLENENYIAELEKENEQLSRAYYFANDSLKKLMFEKANQLNKFSQSFDDDKLKIDVSGISRGTIESIKAEYTIKKQNIPQKSTVFGLNTGLEYGNSLDLTKSVFKGNIEVELRRGRSFSYSYDTDQRHWLGFKVNVFDIKR